MRRDDAVRKLRERVVGAGWLFVKHVGAVAADLAGLQCGGDVVGVDDFTAGAVENEHALLHLGDVLGTDQVAGLRGQVGVEREVVGGREDFVHRGSTLHVILRGELIVPIEVEADYLHAEGAGADGDFLTNAAHTDDTDRLVE